MLAKPLVWLLMGCAAAVTAIRLDAQDAPPVDAATCWASTDVRLIVGGDPACVASWIDSLRSPDTRHHARARRALVAAGGRAAVDALRAEYERTAGLTEKLATIAAMASTGSAADIEFLASQLRGPFTGNTDIWPATQSAAIALRFLRATAARGALASALAQHGSSGFAGRAIARALADLDRPPCVDTVGGNLEDELARIVMECDPGFMSHTGRFRDDATGGTWHFTSGHWRLDPSAQLDSAAPLRVARRVWLAPDRRHAIVMISARCGARCGESWLFRLQRIDHEWRVIGGDMSSVS